MQGVKKMQIFNKMTLKEAKELYNKTLDEYQDTHSPFLKIVLMDLQEHTQNFTKNYGEN
jgi:hypothetical protein